MKRSHMGCGCLGVLAIATLLGLPVVLIECIGYVTCGWFPFLSRTIPKMTIEPAAVAVAGGALVVLTIVAHRLARWLFGSVQANPAADAPRWRVRWTVTSVLLVVFTFVAGIAMIVTFHEVWWLVSSEEPLLVSSGMGGAKAAQSRGNLGTIGIAINAYHDQEGKFPPGGTFNQLGEMQHSWETMLLPFLEVNDSEPPRKDLPWNSPENAEFFKRLQPLFLNPHISSNPEGERRSPQGYALSHYAVNSRVMRGNFAVGKEDVTDGRSNTILAGEVNANFKPWGDPVNWRDPADGLGKSPHGFGSPWRAGITNFLFMDGSVRSVHEGIDPEVLKALSTPAGGEDTRAFFEEN